MENHPLLKELLEICSIHNLNKSKAYTTFDAYLELLEVKKLFDLNYHFDEKLKMFYLSGKKEKLNDSSDIYIPMMLQDSLSPEEIDSVQEHLCQDEKEFYLLIRDNDSSSTCYCITKGLVKPDSPSVHQNKKELEAKKHKLNRTIQNNKKILYTKALKNLKYDSL